MKYLPLLMLGIAAMILSIPNLRGDISTIHWYNRLRISKDDIPKYGKAMGLGSLVMGVSIVLTAVLQMIFDAEVLSYLIVAGVIVGLGIVLYAQFKYNRGIF